MKLNVRYSILTELSRSISLLQKRDKNRIWLITGVQTILGMLDLFGTLLIGLLAAVAFSGTNNRMPSTQFSNFLGFFGLSHLTYQTQAILIAVSASVLLIARTIISILLTRKMLLFLSHCGVKISKELLSKLLSQSLSKLHLKSSQERLYSVTQGIDFIMIQILASIAILIADLALLSIMAVGLFYINQITAIGTTVFFLILILTLYHFMHVRAKILGTNSSILNIESNEKIIEVVNSYREIAVHDRRNYYVREIGLIRSKLADTLASRAFMPYISKYVIETSVLIGALVLGGMQFLIQDSEHAVSTIAIFLTAATRIAPAILRVQQGTIMIINGVGMAKPSLDLIDSLKNVPTLRETNDSLDLFHEGFIPKVSITDVSVIYEGQLEAAIRNISLVIEPGSVNAIVGPSGAGKSTLVDAILGLHDLTKGSIAISGMDPIHAITKWPGSISYVPQNVIITSGSIKENVALGYPNYVATDALVSEALKQAKLFDFVSKLSGQFNSNVGENGEKLSGGERQRLGIARALFTHPKLLILDEATSLLDSETEESITSSIQALRGSTTILVVAHRLSTIRDADKVIYMEKGEIISVGTFEEVRNANASFDRQAKLMGL